MEEKPTKPHAFISYSHADDVFVKRFRVHIKPFEKMFDFEIWDDSRIRPGQKWKEEIGKKLETAAVIVIFLSADFFASDYVMTNEYPEALRKAKENDARIVAIFASPCAHDEFEISDFQAINAPDQTLQDFQDDNNAAKQERVYVSAVKAIKEYMADAAEARGRNP